MCRKHRRSSTGWPPACATGRRATANSGWRRPFGRAPSPARAGTGCGRAHSTCRASGSRWPPGRSPTSRASGPSRSASSSTCRRRSTISTTRRPASSPPTRKAASPTSTRRSPNGWASTLRASRPATPRLSEIIAGDGMALVRSVRADPGATRDTVIDLDLATVTGEALPVRFMHRVTATREGAPGPSRTIVLNRNLGEDASAELRASEIRFTRFFNSTPMAIAGVDQSGRIVRTNAPFLSLFSSVVDRDAVDRRVRLDTVVHERDRAAFAAALEKAKQRQADIAPLDTVLPGNDDRHIRFYVNADRRRRRRRGRRRGGDRLCRRDDRAEGARDQDGAGPEDAGGRPAGRRHRARLQQRADRHHHGVRPAADQPPAVRPVLPGHHEHQAERQPRGRRWCGSCSPSRASRRCGRRC